MTSGKTKTLRARLRKNIEREEVGQQAHECGPRDEDGYEGRRASAEPDVWDALLQGQSYAS